MTTALLLTLLSVFCIYDSLGPFLFHAGRPLIAGTLAGLIIGQPLLGMAVGATLELTALGVYQYGGATIPDYQTGAIVGTALASAVAAPFDQQVAVALGIGLPAALLLAALDPLGRFLPVFWLHRADHYAQQGNGRGIGLMHWTAFIPWAAVRAIPTFLAALAATSGAVQDIADAIPSGLVDGMKLAGSLLPAVGFALLLNVMPVRRYWYLLIAGFVLFAYLEMPLIGIALCGLVAAAVFVTAQGKPGQQAADDQPPDTESTLTKRDLRRSFWRYFWSYQISWNYERMQAMGFAYSIEPALRRLYPEQGAYSEALQRHLQFFNTSPIVGGPLVLGSAIAMEEANERTSAAGVKVALMGPLAGVGDTLTWAVYNSIIFTIGASWALQGNAIGPIFTMVLVLVPYFLVRRWQFFFAYNQGKRLAARLASGALARLSDGATILGLVVLGGFIPSIVKIVTTLTYQQTITVQGTPSTQTVHIQEQLDALLPFLLPVAVTAVTYLLLRKFRIRTMWLIAGVGLVGLALGWLGWFAPTLPEPPK
ncbi:PTS system mannose/fructose/sorbose family transporter subunit IID [Kibdelosporangium aridum]|uniref:Phosphotransferase system, mannose/fructose/N-acetylgalactosamine-specific component IID n=1 Tax=Kibdelosporangium aridum TaxID=2030 RepID=A0A1Y5XJ72_KIBAR|nr:PTS system mannose/fructose/sorbose family transporter subunit IID [Kibdelosporangium aridum]SMC97445.1 Phosphotransferase system, mannose/fructose/N-acetylgalactosamine-specific component IID [Kibdelosporangium aridum]